MIFWPLSLDFIIFSISDGFGMASPWISNPWRDLLPRNGSRSLRGWNFTQNSNFIKDVTGRNKNYQKYQLWAPDEFIIPPSSRALALHALIISLEPSGKIVKLQNDCTDFSHDEEFTSKLFIASDFALRKTLSLSGEIMSACKARALGEGGMMKTLPAQSWYFWQFLLRPIRY